MFEHLLIFGWYDGPVEGILRRSRDGTVWYFKLFAERPEIDALNSRLFGLWAVPEPDSEMLVEELFIPGSGGQVWPVEGGLGSISVQRVVEAIILPRETNPELIARSQDFSELPEVWNVVRPVWGAFGSQ